MEYSIFFSPTGGTKRVADILCRRLFGEYRCVDLCRDINEFTLTADDTCLVSVPSYGGRVPYTAIERLKRIKSDGAKAILVCVYGNRAWDDTLTELYDTLIECGFVIVAAVAAVAEHSIFRQFASGRPDAADEEQLIEFADRIKTKSESGVFGELDLPGSHGSYKEFAKGGPFKPTANELCSACGICAEACPVGAIDERDPRNTEKDICISCMRCVNICPKHSRDFNADFMRSMAEKMAPKLGGRKDNYLFV